jgi:hypothetical protein
MDNTFKALVINESTIGFTKEIKEKTCQSFLKMTF